MRKLIVVLMMVGAAQAQFGRGNGDWSTAGGDAHRSSWVPSDPKISRASMQKPGFAFLWKMKWEAQALTTPVLLSGYIGYRGFRSLGFVGGRSDNVYAMDTDLGRMEWQKHFSLAPLGPLSAGCAPGMTANVARSITTAFPVAPAESPGTGGRSRAARSAVGEPDQGAAILATLEEQIKRAAEARARASAAAPAVAASAPGSATAPPAASAPTPPPQRRLPNVVYALSSDGMLHAMYVSNGEEPDPALPFLPGAANAARLTVIGEMVYAVVAPNCGVESGVWALDLSTKKVYHSKSGDATSPQAGLAFDGEANIFITTTSGAVVALDSKTLARKDAYTAKDQSFSSVLVFQYKEKTLLAASSNDGRVHVLDAAHLSAAPVFVTPAGMGFGDLATWAQSDGTRWLVSSSAHGVRALKLVDADGAISLQSSWESREMSSLTPIVINGVVFTASDSSPRLVALDGVSGKELWNSGTTIAAPSIHNAALAGGGSQVYLATPDGTLYVFGFPIEH